MLQLHQSRIAPEELKPCISLEEMRELQSLVNQIHVEKSIQEYIVKIVQKSRNYEGIILGSVPGYGGSPAGGPGLCVLGGSRFHYDR